MKHFLAIMIVLLTAPLFGAEAVRSCTALLDASDAAFPVVATGCDEQVAYVGAYFSDSKFRTGLVGSSWAQELSAKSPGLRPIDVPPSIGLYPRELTVTEVRPGQTMRQKVRGHSRLAELREGLMTAVYGHEQAILLPQYVTADRQGRVVVSDPAAHAVHVLDAVQPFRIVAGPHYRLANPGAVATDAENNIYVADPVVGVVAVFDANGRFLRELGKIGDNEGIFYRPVSLAMDRAFGDLYVVDADRQMVFVLDLNGRIRSRIGGTRHESGVTLQQPVAVAVGRQEIVILDEGGGRLQVFDRDLHLLREIDTELRPQANIGMDIDSAGDIYLSGAVAGRIRVYGQNGEIKGEFGKPGENRGALMSPNGICIDENDKMYVTDAVNRRVVVMQISVPEARTLAKLGTP